MQRTTRRVFAPRQDQADNSSAKVSSGKPPIRPILQQFCLVGVVACVSFTAEPATAQPVDCDAYARSYADAHVSSDPTDLAVVDRAMRGAVAGGAWEGPSGARRGATAGGALAVLGSLGNHPAGWRGLYDLAYRLCRNQQSTVTHRPTTLGDPSYRASPSPLRQAVPPKPERQIAPRHPNQ